MHEAYLRLLDPTRANWKAGPQVRAVAAATIRRILVDDAGKSPAASRGGGRTLILDKTLGVSPFVELEHSPVLRGGRPPFSPLAREDGRGALNEIAVCSSEYSWLLSRNYTEESALKLVGEQHGLPVRPRRAVMRSVCPDPAGGLAGGPQ